MTMLKTKKLKVDLLKELKKDFESTTSMSDTTLKRQCDRLAAFAHVALETLEANGQADFLLLKHDELRDWWAQRKHHIAVAEQARLEKLRRAELKAQALLKLTAEEREILGIK